MIEYAIEHLCSFGGVGGTAPEVIGEVGEGLRINFHLTGGTVTGPEINGVVREAGGDWLTVRRDGVGLVDARVTLQTDDAALILLTYTGLLEFGADGYERFLREGPPEAAPIRVAVRLFTGHAKYKWLNRVQAFGVGHFSRADRTASYDVYGLPF
jgi:hypothetical protein